MVDQSNYTKDMGKLGGTNFLVSIYRHENHSWQGAIQRLDTGVSIRFRSEQELIHLIGEAVRKDFDESSSLRGWNDAQDIQAI